MAFPMDYILGRFDLFLLVFTRMTGLFVVAPVFGRRNIPSLYKVALSFFMTIILINTLNPAQAEIPAYSQNILGFALIVIKEFLTGILLGFSSFLVFSAVYLGGQIIDMQIGFSFVSVLDPVTNIQVPVTSNLYYILLMMFFLIINGHHYLIEALFRSYEVVPIGRAVFTNDLMNNVIGMIGQSIAMGFKIAAPMVAAILITDIALGVISKTIPQMNIFVVGLPLKIVIGLVILMITIPAFNYISEYLTGSMQNEMNSILKHLVNGP